MLGVLLIVAVIFALPRGISFVNAYFAANGVWYGPTVVHAGSLTGTVETFMSLSTQPTGSISGSGTYCGPTLLGDGLITVDFAVSGQRQGDGSFKLSISAAADLPAGLRLFLGPSLNLRGTVANGIFDLTGGSNTFPARATLKHGSRTDFTTACHAVTPLGV
jgi:hypothetical protein